MTRSTHSVAADGEPSPEGDATLPPAEQFEPGDDSPDRDDPSDPAPGSDGVTTSTMGGETKRKRRRRGGVRRRKRPGREASAADEGAGVSPGEEAEPTHDSAGGASAAEGPEGPRRKRRRRRRRTGSGPAEGEVVAAGDDESGAGEGERSDDAQDAREAGQPERAGKRSRRRRGKRGGRRDTRQSSDEGPVEVETIPGESDELAGEDGELPELPDDAELVDGSEREQDGRRSRRGRKRGRPAAREPESDEPPSRKSRRNVILVNAVDREETRVAVVEDGRINEFQMTVRRHKSLVNDIYRGRVVNLEPAIGAAFIDFGQGRNGFLHTSDVLSAYGEADWKLDKLLTTKIDPEEWDSESSQPDVAVELSEVEAAEDLGEADEDADGPVHAATGDEHESSEELLAEGEELTVVEEEPAAVIAAPRSKPKEVRRERGKQRQRARPRLPITDLLKKGDQVVVQVTKDAIGDKGPTLTTYISIPGRYLVLMPSMDAHRRQPQDRGREGAPATQAHPREPRRPARHGRDRAHRGHRLHQGRAQARPRLPDAPVGGLRPATDAGPRPGGRCTRSPTSPSAPSATCSPTTPSR
jgi:hypothetical protein